MTNLEIELAHLVGLMAPPMREYWKTYCWAKAVYLSESNPKEYADLPRLLTEAMLRAAPLASGEKEPDLSSTPPPSPQRTGEA